MKIGILSDTHNRLVGIDGAFEVFRRQHVDMIVHCGDWMNIETVRYIHEKAQVLGTQLKGVLGNNDKDIEAFLTYASQYSDSGFELVEGVLRFTADGQTIAVYHGHHIPTRRRLVESPDADVLFLGHSHKPLVESSSAHIVVNPGSTAFAIPRRKGWQPSVAIYSTKTRHAEVIEYTIDP